MGKAEHIRLWDEAEVVQCSRRVYPVEVQVYHKDLGCLVERVRRNLFHRGIRRFANYKGKQYRVKENNRGFYIEI